MSEKYRILRVDPCGQADFDSLSSAAFFLKNNRIPTKLILAPTAYNESVVFECSNLVIEGGGEKPEDTLIVDNHFAKEKYIDGFERGTFRTAVLRTDGNNIEIRNLTIKNSSGNGKKYGQAIALYADGLGILVENCALLGYQDTLFTAPFPALNKHGKNEGFGPKNDLPRDPSVQIYRNCYIEGDVDFIFGGATALFEECTIFSHDAVIEMDSNDRSSCRGYICAPCTVQELKYGYVFLGCRLESDCPDKTVYLGRPWRQFGKAVFINCTQGRHIKDELFDDWNDRRNRETSYFAVSEDMTTQKSPDSFYHTLSNHIFLNFFNNSKIFFANCLIYQNNYSIMNMQQNIAYLRACFVQK